MEPAAWSGPVIATDTRPPRSNSASRASSTSKRNLLLSNTRSEVSMPFREQTLSVPPTYSPSPERLT